jgi:hypothetical protein
MIATTYHTYSDLLLNGGRLAASDWGNIRTGSVTLAEAVAATINRDAERSCSASATTARPCAAWRLAVSAEQLTSGLVQLY